MKTSILTIRRFFGALLPVIIMAALASTSCASLRKVKDIKVTSVGVESYSFSGLRSVDAMLAIGIDNPTFAFKVTGLNGILKYKGQDFAFYSADTVKVDARCVKVYDLPCSAVLSEGVTLRQALQIAKKGSLDGFTTDVEAKVRLKNGAGTTLKFKDMDLQKMAEGK